MGSGRVKICKLEIVKVDFEFCVFFIKGLVFGKLGNFFRIILVKIVGKNIFKNQVFRFIFVVGYLLFFIFLEEYVMLLFVVNVLVDN